MTWFMGNSRSARQTLNVSRNLGCARISRDTRGHCNALLGKIEQVRIIMARGG